MRRQLGEISLSVLLVSKYQTEKFRKEAIVEEFRPTNANEKPTLINFQTEQ